jgi:hypothetical protein
VAQLATALNRTFADGAETTWITSLLEDASTYLRDDVIGLQVYPQSQSSFTAYPQGGTITIPQQPLISIDTVQRDGLDVDYSQFDNIITLHELRYDPWRRMELPVDITFTYGYTAPPASLTRWCMVLVSQALLPLEAQLGLTAGGLSSVAIDDFKAAWANAGEESGITLSDRNIKLLREQFGTRGTTVVTTR